MEEAVAQRHSSLLTRGAGVLGTLLGLGLAVATVLGFLGERWWFFDLFSHFRMHYLLGLCCAVLLVFVGRHWVMGGLLSLALIFNAWLVIPYLPTTASPTVGKSFHVAILNVNTHSGDPSRVATWLRSAQPQLIVLEEVSQDWLENLREATDRYPYSHEEPRDDNFGIALYSEFELQSVSTRVFGDTGLPSIVAEVRLGDRVAQVIGTHPLPPIGSRRSTARNRQLQSLAEWLAESPHETILLGDLNATPWCPHLQRFLQVGQLQDSGIGRGWHPTWPAAFGWLGIPLDHCLHTSGIAVQARSVGPDVGSDHRPVSVQVLWQN